MKTAFRLACAPLLIGEYRPRGCFRAGAKGGVSVVVASHLVKQLVSAGLQLAVGLSGLAANRNAVAAAAIWLLASRYVQLLGALEREVLAG